MTIEISFSLDDKDIEYFRGVMNRAQDAAGNASEQEIIQEARNVLDGVDQNKAPLFVRDRLERLATMIVMLEDPEWPLEGQERTDVVSALAYFHNPADLISDDVPVIGLIDDAIMIELVARELTHQLEAYDEFCVYRSSEERLRGKDVSREDWLKAKQQELMKRMRERMGRINRSERGSTRLTRFSFLR
ncbi:MAG TPA: YkvA family protein [Xanthomonadales bacterium]|nr:YkvA family protein [Xanthomonadales bacterium]